MRCPRRVFGQGSAVFVIGLVLLAPRLATADDTDELIKQGVALRRSGDDAGALKLFQQAYQTSHSKRALAQVGFAEQALGQWPAAHEHLTQSLTEPGDAWIKKNRPLITEALQRVSDHVGQLAILGGSPGAEVRIDGTLRGRLPLAQPLLLTTGGVTIDLVAPGFVSRQRSTTIRSRETVRESFDALEPAVNRGQAPGTPTTVAPTAPTNVAVVVPPPVGPPLTTVPPPADVPPADQGAGGGSSLRPAAKWVAWGAGAVALGVGVFGAVRQNSAGDDFSAGCAVNDAGQVVLQAGSTKTVDQCQSLKGKVDSNFTLEVVGLVGAGVFAAAGAVLWLTEPASGNEPRTSSLSCTPGVTPGFGPSFGCRIRF